MATRTNPRRHRHRKQNSLTAYDSSYDQRHIHYAASPTPGNSASRHHRRNSLKAKQLNISTYNAQNLNIKFSKEEMNETNDKKALISVSNESKQYKFNYDTISPTKASSINTKTTELKEWELTLKIKENEMNQMKLKNTQFIQSLQKQIGSLTKALNEERNKTKKHKLSADELSELDAIKRENSALRVTIHRMKDEMQVFEAQENGTYGSKLSKAQNIHNNYYINAINYNNIINNNSNVNFQSQENGLFSIESLSLREMERKIMKRSHVLDEKEAKISDLWHVYREEKSALDSDRNSLAIAERELFRNNRRLKMKLQQLNLLKHDEIMCEIPKLLEITGTKSSNHEEMSRFSSIQLKSIKNSICDEYKTRKQNVNNLKVKFEKFKHKMNEMEENLKECTKNDNIAHKKYSQAIYEIIDKYLANKKKDNALIRRFDTKQFDPIDVNKIMRMKSEETQESEEEVTQNKKVVKHQTQFSFERNMSFDISDLENELIEHKEEEAQHKDIESIPSFNRKRTMSMKLDEKHLPLNKKDNNDDDDDNKEVDINKKYKFDDMDLLRIISLIENENDALREAISAYKCDKFSLESLCFCLKYDKQLLLEQIDEINEVNAEIAHKMKEMSEYQRDSGILRQELFNKDLEITIKHDALRGVHTKYEKIKIEYDAKCQHVEKMAKEKDVLDNYWNEYLWKEWKCIKNMDSIYDELVRKKNIKPILKSIQIEIDTKHNRKCWKDLNSKHKLKEKLNSLNVNKFEFPPIIAEFEMIAMKLLQKIGALLLSQNTEYRVTSNETLALKSDKSEIEALKKANASLSIEREDIYSLFSSYKKRVKHLESELKALKIIETEHQQIAQQLSQTQNELETEQQNHRKFKLKTDRKISAMTEIEAKHRKLSSASFAKQRLDSLLGQSEEILRNYAYDEEEEDESSLYYGADTKYNADTMLIVQESDKYEAHRTSSMVINDDIIQDSKIDETHLSKDIDIEIYGFDVAVLSPLQRDESSTNPVNKVPRFDFNPKTNTSYAHKHWPQDSFMAMAPDIKKQILDKSNPNSSEQKTQFQIMYDEYNENNTNTTNTGRRNTVDRYIESRDEIENKKEIQIISEQETHILSPGASPLNVINNNNDEQNLKSKFDARYRAILETNANKFNSTDLDVNNLNNMQLDEDDEDDDDMDINDIYGEYGDKQAHKSSHSHKNNSSSLSSVVSHASDGYLELSDTMKISREQFQELRNQHNVKLNNQLSEIHEMELEMHKKNESVDVMQEYELELNKTQEPNKVKKHKRNATTVVHVADVDVPQFDNNRVRGSHNIEALTDHDEDDEEEKKKVDPPTFNAKKNHKTSNSVVSEHGTHYISYEADTPRAAANANVSDLSTKQVIDEIISNNKIHIK